MRLDRKIQTRGIVSDLLSLAGVPEMVTRYITLGRQRMVVRLEAPIWDAVEDIAQRQGVGAEALSAEIAVSYAPGLAPESALRSYVLNHYRERGAC
jgi:predicted DNA-binding ribbon-helix-helix protein